MDEIMSKFAYDSLSEEEKKAFMELCKEDPAVFVERVVGINLKGYQKVHIRETFKRVSKEKADDVWRASFQQEPIKPRCRYCNGNKLISMGFGLRGLRPCSYCK